jgi:hypothetical protein
MKKIISKRRGDSLTSKLGMGTVEIVIIIAVLVALALIFRTALMDYADGIMDSVFDDDKVISDISY